MSRESNREKMPRIAAFVDQVRECFGDVRVTYAREGGLEFGKPDTNEGVVPVLPLKVTDAPRSKKRR